MIGGKRFVRLCVSACAFVLAMCAASVAAAAPDSAGPAYGVEPGEAPKNSVPVGAQGASPDQAPKAPAPPPAPAAPPSSASAPQGAPAPAPDQPATDVQPAAPPGGPGATESTEVSDNDPRALTEFKPQLDPYGAWVEDPKYGIVWVPDHSVVGEGFSPYVTAGHWALDTAGNWVWVSDYPFGNVVFHYGRWVWTSYGWSWVPGYRYAPAWVVWRVPTADYAYVGWAPAPPAYVWWGGIGMSIWWGPPYYWVFCPSHFVFTHYTSYYVVHDRAFVHTLAGSTRRYVAASPRVTSSPTMQAARIPSSSIPSSRVPAHPIAAHSLPMAGRAPQSSALSRTARPNLQAPSTVPNAGQRGFSSWRTYSAPSRSATPGAYSAPGRSFAAPPRTYSPSPGFTAPSRVYSPSPRLPSAGSTYSAPRVYSPSPRVYSSPHVSAPAYRAPSYHPSFSAPRSAPAPHFGGGGGHHR